MDDVTEDVAEDLDTIFESFQPQTSPSPTPTGLTSCEERSNCGRTQCANDLPRGNLGVSKAALGNDFKSKPVDDCLSPHTGSKIREETPCRSDLPVENLAANELSPESRTFSKRNSNWANRRQDQLYLVTQPLEDISKEKSESIPPESSNDWRIVSAGYRDQLNPPHFPAYTTSLISQIPRGPRTTQRYFGEVNIEFGDMPGFNPCPD